LYDLKKEIIASGLVLEGRTILSKKSVFTWLSFSKPLKIMFEFIDKVVNFEGYLTVLIIKKKI
jgi:hypothetical protein